MANIRSAYAELMADYLTDPTKNEVNIKYTQKQDGWQSAEVKIAGADIKSKGTDLTKGATIKIESTETAKTETAASSANVKVTINGVEVPERISSTPASEG